MRSPEETCMGPTIRVPVSRVLVESRVASRRQLRRSKYYLYFDDGSKLGVDDDLELSAQPVHFTVRGERFEARFGTPSLAWLDKPAGVITGRDPHQRTAESVLRMTTDVGPVEPVGRLDKDTEGLLLFTSDGGLLHRLIHPKSRIPRTYLAALARPPDQNAIEALANGTLELRDGHRPVAELAEASSDLLSRYALGGPWWTVTLRSGKYHEVRRLCAASGSHVDRLVRISFGPVSLPAGPPGGARSGRFRDGESNPVYDAVDLAPKPVVTVHRVRATETPTEGSHA